MATSMGKSLTKFVNDLLEEEEADDKRKPILAMLNVILGIARGIEIAEQEDQP